MDSSDHAMKRTVQVSLCDRSYDVVVGCALSFAESVNDLHGQCVLLVSDTHVDPLHGDRCAKALTERGARVSRSVVPAGEASKSLDSAGRLFGNAVEAGLDRRSLIVALGGGVVGDLAGFVAATYLRGVRYLQVPTTLLAMVDSSVGGKTAVNLPQGKNLVGAFHQPIGVIADLDTLATLPRDEYLSGLAEVVKYGMIRDAAFFDLLESETDGLLQRDTGLLADVVARCCEIKAEVVGHDERETGERAILNFGHTLGHALEKVSGYGRWRHGEAVAMGMVYATRLSVSAYGFPANDLRRLEALLRRLELPVTWGDQKSAPAWPALREAMAADKKTLRRVPRWVLAEHIGSVRFGCELSEDVLERVYTGGMSPCHP